MTAALRSALLLSLLGASACTFGLTEPPCERDDNCAAPARCDTDTRRCVLASELDDGGTPDGGG